MRLSTIDSQLLNEVSSIKTQLGKGEEIEDLIEYLHRKQEVPHNLEFEKIDKPSDVDWAQYKQVASGLAHWMLFKCEQGVAAVSLSRSGYEVVLAKKSWGDDIVNPDTGEVYSGKQNAIDQIAGLFTSGNKLASKHLIDVGTDRKDSLLKIIRMSMGKIKELYVTTNIKKQTARNDKRTLRKAQSEVNAYNVQVEKIEKRFKPMLLRMITQADAEISGALGIVIKAKGYNRASELLTKLKKLAEERSTIERGKSPDYDSITKSALRFAISLAGAHIYHDDVNAVERTGYGHMFAATVRSHSGESVENKVVKDIANGNMKTLGVVLAYYKRYLMMVK